jgi:hypothetical protein|tara:strand:+ start:3611 stop:3949 length:339 start_codon:yes stop_codon:yes gene_type:complete
MASAYINIAKLVGSTGDVIVYTVPAATQSIIKNLQLYNSHTGSIVIYPKITDTSASVTVTLQKITLATLASTAESADTSLTGPFVLETGDTLVLNCAVASKIYAFASVLELS